MNAFDKHKTGCDKCRSTCRMCKFGEMILLLVSKNTTDSHAQAELLHDLVDNARFAQAALLEGTAPLTQTMAAKLLQTTFLRANGSR